jgi:hypothetical protein
MANPNIVNVTSILGKTAVQAVGTGAADIVANSASSGYIVKINNLNISNITASPANIIVSVFRSSVEYKIVHNVSVPASAAFTAIDKPTGIYLEEGDSLRLTAGTGSALHAVCSYEIIS